jgi:hypothetical protein
MLSSCIPRKQAEHVVLYRRHVQIMVACINYVLVTGASVGAAEMDLSQSPIPFSLYSVSTG